MPLNSLQCTGRPLRPPLQRVIQPPMAVVPRVGNPPCFTPPRFLPCQDGIKNFIPAVWLLFRTLLLPSLNLVTDCFSLFPIFAEFLYFYLIVKSVCAPYRQLEPIEKHQESAKRTSFHSPTAQRAPVSASGLFPTCLPSPGLVPRAE